jgi:hypothetical protein
MLTASASGWLGLRYTIWRGDSPVATLTRRFLCEGCTFEAHGVTYAVRRLGWWGPFCLECNAVRVAEARLEGFLRTRYRVSFGPMEYELRPASWASAFKMALFQAGRQIGVIRLVRWFSHTVIIDLPEDMPVFLQVFLFSLLRVHGDRYG